MDIIPDLFLIEIFGYLNQEDPVLYLTCKKWYHMNFILKIGFNAQDKDIYEHHKLHAYIQKLVINKSNLDIDSFAFPNLKLLELNDRKGDLVEPKTIEFLKGCSKLESLAISLDYFYLAQENQLLDTISSLARLNSLKLNCVLNNLDIELLLEKLGQTNVTCLNLTITGNFNQAMARIATYLPRLLNLTLKISSDLDMDPSPGFLHNFFELKSFSVNFYSKIQSTEALYLYPTNYPKLEKLGIFAYANPYGLKGHFPSPLSIWPRLKTFNLNQINQNDIWKLKDFKGLKRLKIDDLHSDLLMIIEALELVNWIEILELELLHPTNQEALAKGLNPLNQLVSLRIYGMLSPNFFNCIFLTNLKRLDISISNGNIIFRGACHNRILSSFPKLEFLTITNFCLNLNELSSVKVDLGSLKKITFKRKAVEQDVQFLIPRLPILLSVCFESDKERYRHLDLTPLRKVYPKVFFFKVQSEY